LLIETFLIPGAKLLQIFQRMITQNTDLFIISTDFKNVYAFELDGSKIVTGRAGFQSPFNLADRRLYPDRL
jgi:hypothetical protein